MTIPFSSLPKILGRLVKISLVGMVLLSGAACSKSPAQLEKKYYSQGEHYLAEGKFNEAIIEFRNLLKINPKSPKGRLGLAESYLKKGWTAQSVLEFQEVAKESPLMLDPHLELARYGVNSGQWNAVRSEIATILKIDPNNTEGLSFEGERYLALGHENKALATFKRALSISPGSVIALVGMGDLLRHQNHLRQAKTFYDKALATNAKSSSALIGLGKLAQANGNISEAQDEFRKAMEANKGDLRARIVYANFLASQNHSHQAIALLEGVSSKAADLRIPVKIAEYEVLLGENDKAIQLMHPLELQKIPLPDIYLILAKAYQSNGRIQEALDEADHLSRMGGVPPVMKIVAARVEMAGGNPGKAKEILNSISGVPRLPVTYWLTRGEAEEFQNNPSKAIIALNEGLKNYPDDRALLLSLADAEAQGKKYGESKKILERLLAKDPKNAAIIGRLGNLMARMYGTDAEISYFKKSAKKYPEITGDEFLYLLSLASSKKLPQAIEEAKSYLSTHSDNQQVRFLLAQFEFQQGHKNKAISLYKTILGSDPKNVQALHALADQELGLGHLPEAESLYRRSLAIQPNNPSLDVGLGTALLAEKQVDPAKSFFEKALSINPNQPQALLEMGKLAIMSGETQQALTHLTPLLKANFSKPQKAQIYWLWGVATENNKDFNAAIKSYKKAIQLDPKNAFYHASLGTLYANLNEWDLSLPELDKSLAFGKKIQSRSLLKLTRDWVALNKSHGASDTPKIRQIVSEASNYQKSHAGDPSSGLIEARADLLLKDFPAAENVFDHILSTHPDDPLAILGKSSILLSQNHPRKARSLINRLLSTHPNDVQANLMMASIEQKEGNTRGEINRLEKVHEAHPDWVEPSVALVGADLNLGRFQEAKSIAFALHESHPKLPVSLFLLGNAEMGLKNYRDAMKDFGKLVKETKKPAPIYNMMSVAAMKLGDSTKAQKFLTQAVADSPNDPAVLNNMAFFMAQNKKDLSKALNYAKKAEKIAPQPFVQDTIGYIFFKMGDYGQAESYFHTAYAAHFRDPEFLYHMGLNEWKLGKSDQASSHLRKAVTSGALTSSELETARKALHKLSS